VAIESRIIQSHFGHKEACFQKAVINRGRQRMRRKVRQAAALGWPKSSGQTLGSSCCFKQPQMYLSGFNCSA
jgi:hypothetical protein